MPFVLPGLRAVYFVAFTARSGSNLLCEYLRANGLGEPTEYFQHPFGRANRVWYDTVGADPDDFLKFAWRILERQTANGLFGSKLSWTHRNVLADVVRAYAGGAADPLDGAFADPTWVRVRRRDVVAQAVSLWRARRSGEWLRPAGGAAVTDRPAYSYVQIVRCLEPLLAEELFWDEYFRGRGVEPLTVYYEDLIAAPADTAFAVIDALQTRAGVRLVGSPADVRLLSTIDRQGDAYNDEVRARVLADTTRLDVPGQSPPGGTWDAPIWADEPTPG